MVKNKLIRAGLMEATHLTRAGRLVEATVLIKRILQHGSAANENDDRCATDGYRGQANGVTGLEFSTDAKLASRLTHLPTAVAERVGQRSDVIRFFRGRSDRECTIVVPRPQLKKVDEQPGQFVTGSYANSDGARVYKLYVPSTYAGQPLPLIVMLHGCTQSPDDFADGTRMNELAEERQCFVLYPEQTQAANHSRCWNWFKRGDQRRDQGEPAILAGMTREVLNRYRIHPAKVYVAGLSAGGAMAAVMSAAYPELYTAVGIHSGVPCGSAHDLSSALAAMRGVPAPMIRNMLARPLARPMPTIVFHGDRDKTVHPRNSDRLVSQSAEQNGVSSTDATTERGQVPGGYAYSRTTHHGSTGRVVLEHWLVHEGGHAWFGGSARGSYVDSKGPDAAREMIRFFINTPVSSQ